MCRQDGANCPSDLNNQAEEKTMMRCFCVRSIVVLSTGGRVWERTLFGRGEEGSFEVGSCLAAGLNCLGNHKARVYCTVPGTVALPYQAWCSTTIPGLARYHTVYHTRYHTTGHVSAAQCAVQCSAVQCSISSAVQCSAGFSQKVYQVHPFLRPTGIDSYQ